MVTIRFRVRIRVRVMVRVRVRVRIMVRFLSLHICVLKKKGKVFSPRESCVFSQIGRAHVRTPVTPRNRVCRI